MHDQSLATGENESNLNSMCACDDKVVSNHENSEILPDGPTSSSNLGQSKAVQENETKELSQTPAQKRKRGRPRKNESVITISPRLLRARSQEKTKTEIQESVDLPLEEPDSKENKMKMTKRMKPEHNNEYSKIKKHLRYLLNRMKYEQNFIDAYAGEGWKGQSLEKLRPEKELERAKSDIRRYKLKIRDLFKRIDTSREEGRIPETLYDSEGLIDCEDIFCAKCRKIEVSLDNDIILCDGGCERGFHQFCLDPPLLKEQVPPGDEGWLCPACDCKADCIGLLNDTLGTQLAIEDCWEKVFPETAASGNKLDDNSGLPSDDSEDDDYNPDGPQLEDEADAEDSSYDEAEDLGTVANNKQLSELPSDDSEDDDFNPDRVDSDEEDNIKSSGSTSSSDDLSDIKDDVASVEVQTVDMSADKDELLESNMENDEFAPITAKRNVERLDYKKLHDETYGNSSSDSSDEDFHDSETEDTEYSKNQRQIEITPAAKTKTSKKLDVEGTSDKSGKSSNRRIGKAASKRLYEAFKENHYPDRTVREKLVNELNLTHSQVSKWFGNARWSFNHPEGRTKTVKSPGKRETSADHEANR